MKVAVIGASISGLFLAYLLAKEGVEVEVIEKEEETQKGLRTLIVTGKIREVMEVLPQEVILNQIKYLELFSKSQTLRLELHEPDLVIERGKLLYHLDQLAQNAGAKVLFQHKFEGFTPFGRKILMNLQNLKTDHSVKISTDILVGADGAFSKVSHCASADGHPLVALRQARVASPYPLQSETSQVWFNPDLTKYFYWLIPESDQIAAIGLIADQKALAEDLLNMFLNERGLSPLEVQSAMISTYRLTLKGNYQSFNRKVFLVGDAAGQVKMTTVGGVVTGVLGSRALANALLNGRNYLKELNELKHELGLHYLIRQVLNQFDDQHYDKLFEMINGKLKEILQERNRDDLTGSLLRMVLAEPRLIILGAKALLKSLF